MKINQMITHLSLIALMLIFTLPATGETFCVPGVVSPVVEEEEVYRGLPFTPGERAEYAVSYMGLSAGRAHLEVRPPILKDGVWHRLYAAEAHTGKWYRMIFVGHDSILAYSHSVSGMASHFILDQDEGKLLGSRLHKHTEIHFDHQKCIAMGTVDERGKTKKNEQFEINSGVMDTLSATFQIRAFNYQPGAALRLPVYSSGKSWWLRVEMLGEEKIEVPAGVFSTIKLRLHTYLGDALQQKGDLLAWLALDRSERPIVQVKAEVRIGSLQLELVRFQPGKGVE
ncbi:hypothetical protein CCP3SC5AM1_780011 [Gammaproteobacteria bacterium]